MTEDTLQIAGKGLFSAGLLRDHLTEQVKMQLERTFDELVAVNRPVRRLHVNRAFGSAHFSGAVTLAPAATMAIINARTADGRQVAEHRSVIEGNSAFLHFAPDASPPGGRLPRGMVKGSELIFMVAFGEDDLPFVATLVQAELELVRQLLDQQRQELERFNAGLPALIRRMVAAQWPHLSRDRSLAN